MRLAFNALYQEGLHVPALIYAPTLLQPGVIQGPRQQVDVMPTLLELLGLRSEGMLEWRAAAELSMFARSGTDADGRVSWVRR